MTGSRDYSDGLSDSPDDRNEKLSPSNEAGNPISEFSIDSSDRWRELRPLTDSSQPIKGNMTYSLPAIRLDGRHHLTELESADPLSREVLEHLGMSHFPLVAIRHRRIFLHWLRWQGFPIPSQRPFEFAFGLLISAILLGFRPLSIPIITLDSLPPISLNSFSSFTTMKLGGRN